jgi:ethanolamine permease
MSEVIAISQTPILGMLYKMSGQSSLKRILTPTMVWGLGVGYVISGNYFGWNLGLAHGGTLGLGVALVFIIVMYTTFTLCYTELACAIPQSGGAFEYARRAFGPDVGFIAGMAQNIEFIFAPPAIAFGIGAYLNLYFPSIPVLWIAIAAYVIFVGLNITGIRIAAAFELGVTAIAVAALLVFALVTFPHVEMENLRTNALPNGWSGAMAAVPFAIWFFLGIEGVANLAEEAVNPRRTIMLGFGSAIATLVILCLLTFVGASGVAGWEAVVYNADRTISDSPLPMAMAFITDGVLYKLVIFVGLFGLVASFHGLMLAGGRSTYEFGKVGYAPAYLGRIHPRFQTPVSALVTNMVLGIAALLTGKTGEIITIAVFGALTLYVISMLSMIKLRRSEPSLQRPFRSPGYPWFPAIALLISAASIVAMAIYNASLVLIYIAFLLGSFVIYRVTRGSINSKSE